MIFCYNKDCFSEYLLHMSLFTFAGEITMSKEMPIKNGDHYIPKPIIPIYTPNTNESAHFPKLSLTTDVIYLYHFDQLCFTYTFLNMSETFFQMLNWPFAFSYLNTLPKYFFSCYKYCFSSLSSPFAIFLVCSTNQPPKRWSCTLQDGLREGRSVSELSETGDKGSARGQQNHVYDQLRLGGGRDTAGEEAAWTNQCPWSVHQRSSRLTGFC